MCRRDLNLYCYGAAGVVLLAGIWSFASGRTPLGLILSVGAITYAVTLFNRRPGRDIFRPSRSPVKGPIRAVIIPGPEGKLVLRCARCGRDNFFDQPYPYHAGFGDHGFMYSDSGHFTLTWSLYDPVIGRFFPQDSGSSLYPSVAAVLSKDGESARSKNLRLRFEAALRPAPDGGSWKFENPARCLHCSAPIAGSNLETIYYFIYPGSIVTQKGGAEMTLGEYLNDKA